MEQERSLELIRKRNEEKSIQEKEKQLERLAILNKKKEDVKFYNFKDVFL